MHKDRILPPKRLNRYIILMKIKYPVNPVILSKKNISKAQDLNNSELILNSVYYSIPFLQNKCIF